MILRLVTSLFLFSLLLFQMPQVAAQDLRPIRTPDPSTPIAQNYAPDRIIVKYREGESKDDIKEKIQQRSAERKNALGRFRLQTADMVQYGLGDRPEDRLKDIEAVEQRFQIATTPLAPSLTEELFVAEQSDGENLDVEQAIRAFEQLPEVEFAEPDYKRTATFTPNDEFYSAQWMFSKINAATAWDLSQGHSNVVIAVVDTGIHAAHPDLAGRVTLQVNCARDGGCISGGTDDMWHGTAVAGIASAVTHNGSGVAGTGFNTKLYSFKVLDSTGNGYVSWSMQALQYLTSLNNGQKIIVNMSFGGVDGSSSEEAVINAAWNDGMVLIASAGNDNVTTVNYPAGYANVIAVGALNNTNQKASYSNYGSWVDVTAPGGDCQGIFSNAICLLTTDFYLGQVGYVRVDGTSFSAPVVSGVASLIWGRNPALTNAQVRTILQSTATAIAGTGTNWKYGIVNAQAAVQAATSNPTATQTPIPPTPTLGSVCYQTTIHMDGPTSGTTSPGQGNATIHLNTSTNELYYDITFSGLTTAETAAHIHGMAAPGVNAGIVHPLPVGSPKVGTWVYSENQQTDIMNGLTYVNVHSTQYPGGEIRGQINQWQPASCSPSPTITKSQQPGDTDGDGDVDIFDYNAVLSNFGKSVTGPANGDLDTDGDVDIFDYNAVISNFGK